MLDHSPAIAKDSAPLPLQRSHGAARLRVAHTPRGSALAELYHKDPCRLLFPDSESGELLQAVLATTSGGLAGGDTLDIDIVCDAHARALVVAQAAEKVYRMLDAPARMDVRLSAGTGAWLEWLPQDTILFEGAGLHRTTQLTVENGASILAAELLVLGRQARGERFTRGLLHDAWDVRFAGKLVWADALRLERDIEAQVAASAGLGGNIAQATVLLVNAQARELLDFARGLLGDGAVKAGVSCIGPVLAARFLGPSGQAVRAAVAHYWAGLRARASGLPARMPRMWHI